MMEDANANEVLERLSQLKGDRSSFESQWNDIDRYVAGAARFGSDSASAGDRRGLKMFESAPIIAVSRLSSALASLMTPQNEQWHRLEIDSFDEEDHEAKVYAEEVNKRLFKARYSPRSGFATQAPEWYRSLVRYGTAIMMILDDLQGIKYRCLSLATTYIDENFQGQVDTVYRRYQLTARQALQQFGDDAPQRVKDAKPSDKFWFVQKVCPATDREEGRADYKGMLYRSYDVCEDTKETVKTGGYRTFPFAVARFSVSDGDLYAYSPLMEILPTVKLANAMKKDTIRAGQLANDSPLLADDSLQAFQIVPGAIIRGGMGEGGKRRVEPLYTGKNVPYTSELMDRERKTIYDAMFLSLFEILAEDRRQMTAQEVLQRAQEKGQLIGPIASGIEPALGSMITRELDIMAIANALPEMPASVREIGARYQLRYTNPITRAQKAGDAIATYRMFEAAGIVAQYAPDAIDKIDFDAAMEVIADAEGTPSKVLRSDEDVAKIREGKRQQQEQQQMLEAVPAAAQSAKYLAEAQAMSTSPAGGAF